MSHSSETGETGKATADRGAGSWWRWPTWREWLIIGIAIGWPVGLYLYSQYGARRVFREFAGLASLVVCSGLLLAIRGWQIARFWLLAILLSGSLLAPRVADRGDGRPEWYFIETSIVGLFVGLVWNDVCAWYRTARRE